MNNKLFFEELEKYASKYSVPIIEKEGLEYLENIIKKHNPQKVLEIGTAIGYSALKMNAINDCNVVTFERNEKMIEQAKQNISKASKENKIKVLEEDFLKYDINKFDTKSFDLIYIDGAKAQYYNFFKHIENKISQDTIVIFDNLKFHGYVNNEELKSKASKNLKQLIRKIEEFLKKIKEEKNYNFEFIDVGDGIGVLKKH